jgi:hypothetical protein
VRGTPIPFVGNRSLTGYGRDDDLQRAREAGFDVKPATLEQLRAATEVVAAA